MHKQSEPHKIHLELLNGKLYARIAEFWFKYVGYSSLAAGIAIAEELDAGWLLWVTKWLSYFAIYLWLNFVVNNLVFYIWPDLRPQWGSHKLNKWHFIVSNTFSLPLVFLAYSFGVELSRAVIIANA